MDYLLSQRFSGHCHLMSSHLTNDMRWQRRKIQRCNHSFWYRFYYPNIWNKGIHLTPWCNLYCLVFHYFYIISFAYMAWHIFFIYNNILLFNVFSAIPIKINSLKSHCYVQVSLTLEHYCSNYELLDLFKLNWLQTYIYEQFLVGLFFYFWARVDCVWFVCVGE